jgi:hypothetical protein
VQSIHVAATTRGRRYSTKQNPDLTRRGCLAQRLVEPDEQLGLRVSPASHTQPLPLTQGDSNQTMTQVTETLWVNHYLYDPKILLMRTGRWNLRVRKDITPSIRYIPDSSSLSITDYTFPIDRKANLHLFLLSCSIVACLATVLIGAHGIHGNGESYETYFSSISNAIQNPNIVTLFKLHSTDTSPLKKIILSTRIRLVRNGEVERFIWKSTMHRRILRRTEMGRIRKQSVQGTTRDKHDL